MTREEMNRRLATLSEADIAKIRDMISQGYGARGISLETPFTVKQVNAVFQLHFPLPFRKPS